MIFSPSRRNAFKLFGSAALLGFASPAFAYDFPHMRRGINLHHLLNWPDMKKTGGKPEYTWPPFQDANYQIKNEELQNLVHVGFDFVRVTVDPSIFIVMQGEQKKVLIDRMRLVVKQCLAAGLKTIVDLHPVNVNPAYGPEVLVDANLPKAFDAYVDMVESVAKALVDFPPSRIAFEPMNEPWIKNLSEAPRWQPMLEQLHARARTVAPQLPLILTGMYWGDFRALLKLDTRPFKSSNVLYTFHYYDPHSFTHQGVEGDDAQYLSKVDWPLTQDKAFEVYTSAKTAIDASKKDNSFKTKATTRSEQLIRSLWKDGYTEERVEKDFEAVSAWARQNSIARDRILLGEFGCVVSARGEPVGQSRLAWLAKVRDTAEKNGFPWAYWSYKGYGGMELMDVKGHIDPKLLAALGLKNN